MGPGRQGLPPSPRPLLSEQRLAEQGKPRGCCFSGSQDCLREPGTALAEADCPTKDEKISDSGLLSMYVCGVWGDQGGSEGVKAAGELNFHLLRGWRI